MKGKILICFVLLIFVINLFAVAGESQENPIIIEDLTTYTGSLSGEGEEVFYQIKSGTTGDIVVTIGNDDSFYNLYLYVINTVSELQIFDDYIDATNDPRRSIEVTITAEHICYIKVEDQFEFDEVSYSFTVSGNNTLPVELSSFTAVLASSDMVTLNWVSQSESNMIGYNVYRNSSNELNSAIRINPTTIIASNTSNECAYSYTDDFVANGEYWYWLESAEMTGENEFHGPISIKVGNNENIIDPAYDFKHRLVGAYPNPFNPSTSIQYEVAKASDIEISIFNAKGQKVRTFNQTHNSKGVYSVTWNGLDENNNKVSSGVYFYTMTVENETQTKKMMLIK